MRILFKIALLFVLLYLTFDVGIRGEEKTSRPIVQAIGGVSLLLVSWYNIMALLSGYGMHKFWSFIKFWRFFIGLLLLYYILSFFNFPSDYVNSAPRDMVVALYVFSIVLFFFYATMFGHLSSQILNIVIVIVILNGLFEIYYALTFAKIKSGLEIINTSGGYKFLMILPLLLYKYKKDNIWIFLLTIILTMMTGKRGALVIYAVLIFYGFLYYKRIKKPFKVDWKVFVFLGLIFLVYSYFIDTAYQSLEYRFQTIEETERGMVGSGRNIIWGTLLSSWYNADFFSLFFGYGFYSTIAIEGHIAHNDFIEFLVDFGLIGLLLYATILLIFYKNIKQLKTQDSYLFMLLLSCLFIWFGRAIIAGTIRTDQIILSISIGCLLAVNTKQRLYEKKN